MLLRAVTGVAPRELARSRRRRPERAPLLTGRRDAAGLPVLAGPEEATLVGNLLVQAMALGEIGSMREARESSARRSSPTPTSPSRHAGWRESRERFADS